MLISHSLRLKNAFEKELFGDLQARIQESLISNAKKNTRIFTHADDLLDEFRIGEVRLDNYRNLFLVYLGFTSLVLVAVALGNTRKRIKRHTKKLLSNLIRKLNKTCRQFRRFIFTN